MKRKGILFSVVLLVLAGIVMTGCPNGGSSEPTPTTYTVTFDKNCEDTAVTGMPAEKKASSGTKIARPSSPSRPGYDFGGWFKEDDCTAAWDFAKDTVTEDTTLYAKWTEKAEFAPPTGFETVELGDFNWSNTGSNALTQQGWGPNGLQGVVSDVEIEDFIQAQYLWIWVENEPAGGLKIVWQGDLGGNFGGWNESDALSSSGAVVTGVTKTAEQGGYSFKIDLAAVLKKTDSNQSFTDAKAGVRFILGYFSPNLTGLGDMKAYLLLPTGTIAARTYYQVTFDSDGAETIAGINVMSGYPIGAKFPTPEKANFVFDGWKDASNTDYTKNTPITAATTLTAQWLEECTVTFDYGVATLTNVVKKIGKGKPLGDLYVTPPAGTVNASGQVFEGWYTTATGGTKVDADTLITATVTFYYAQYAAAVTITFDSAGGSAVPVLKIPAGTAMGSQYPRPTKSGFRFDGWFNGTTEYTAASSITADITLTAQWTALSGFTLELPKLGDGNQWEFKSDDDDIANIQAAKFLVLEFTSNADANGFGGLQIAMQGDGNDWSWTQYISPDWTDCNSWLNYDDPDDFWIIIDLSSMDVWEGLITAGTTQLFLNSVPEQITFKDVAYLTNAELTMPDTNATDCSKADNYTGWAAKAVDLP